MKNQERKENGHIVTRVGRGLRGGKEEDLGTALMKKSFCRSATQRKKKKRADQQHPSTTKGKKGGINHGVTAAWKSSADVSVN